MAENYIAQTAQDFFASLDRAQKELQTFSQELHKKNSAVFSALERFAEANDTYVNSLASQASELTAVDKALQEAVENLKAAVRSWKNSVESHKKGQKFMNDHEKHLVVMVFGAVKTGKSTLGNFFAGREWIAAPFDNVYKHRPVTVFETEEKGRDTGDIEKVDGRYWFSEGVTDTTGDIQYFTLGGLRWFDSPGTGALAKEGDKRNMEEMVKEYLQYVDLCIFLINSSEPGLMEDMKYMEQLSRTEQEALVVITKSDRVDEDVDEAGDIVKVYVPKTDEARRLQEKDMCERLAVAYPHLDRDKFRAMSVSTLLCHRALKNADEKVFRDSNLDVLMKKLQAKADGDVVQIKTTRPKKAMNKFLHDIVEGDETIAGVRGLRRNLQKVLDSAADFRAKIESRKERLTKGVARRVKADAVKEINRMAHKVENGGSAVGQESVAKMVFSVVHPIVADEINEEVSHVIGTAQKLAGELAVEVAQPEIRTKEIRRKTEQVEHTYSVYKVVRRDPDGVWENVRSFFGKKYYETVEDMRKHVSTVSLGVDTEEIVSELMPQIESYVSRTVQKNLEKIAESYFAPQEAFVQEIEKNLDRLEEELKALHF